MRWRSMTGRDFAFMDFVRGLIALRKRYAVLRWPNFLHGTQIDGDGTRDVVWLRPDGKEMDNASWADATARSIGLLLGDIRPACSSWSTPTTKRCPSTCPTAAGRLARAHRRRHRLIDPPDRVLPPTARWRLKDAA